jgi:hypothetical protein
MPGIMIKALVPFRMGAEPEQVFEDTGASVIFNATPFRYSFSLRGLRMQPVGTYLVDGVSYGLVRDEWGVLWYSPDTGYGITEGLPEAGQASLGFGWAVGGYKKILDKGKNVGIHGERHARTAVGLTGNSEEKDLLMYLLVVEGEERARPGFTSREVALLMERLGVSEALNLDGGDSSLLWIRGNSVYRGGRRRIACYLTVYTDEP